MIRSHGLKLLSTLLETEDSNPSILKLDMFGLLVSLNFSLPSLFNGEGPAPLPSCNIHILRLVFLAHITLIMFAAAASWPAALRPDFCHCPPAKECVALLDLAEVAAAARALGGDSPARPSPLALWQVIMEQSLGFLRRASLFYYYLSRVTAPAELTSVLPPDLEFISLGLGLNHSRSLNSALKKLQIIARKIFLYLKNWKFKTWKERRAYFKQSHKKK